MLLELALVLCAFLYWSWRVRLLSVYNDCPFPVSHDVEDGLEVDFVVIGAGPGGLSAARRLLDGADGGETVLLLECGRAAPSRLFWPFRHADTRALLSHAVDLVGSAVDGGARVPRPFADGAQPFPRGRGLGGTSRLDWGMGAAPLPGLHRPPLTHRPAGARSPLAWAFGAAAGAPSGAFGAHRDGAVLLRVDADGRRLPLAHVALRAAPNLRVVDGCAVGALAAADGAVRAVRCRLSTGADVRVGVRRGLVCAAGVLGTPRLLRPGGACGARDVLGVPLLFGARRGVSDDAVNSRSLAARLAWAFRRRGPFAHAVCDAVAETPLGAGRTAVVCLFPFGGRDAVGFARRGIDRALGVFREGLTLLVLLCGVDARWGADGRAEAFVSALGDGLRFARRIAASPPLSHLTNGLEAVDAALLSDARRAVEYVRLTRAPRGLTPQQRGRAPSVLAWAAEQAETDAYVTAYVRRHAQWMGFASGSCADLLDGEESQRVRGMRNVFIGDCSAVTAAMGGGDEIRAGSVSTAMALGEKAANELLALTREEVKKTSLEGRKESRDDCK